VHGPGTKVGICKFQGGDLTATLEFLKMEREIGKKGKSKVVETLTPRLRGEKRLSTWGLTEGGSL